MTKLNRYLLIALVLQIGLVVVLRVTSQETTSVRPKPVFDKLDSDGISSITIKDDDKVVDLKKQAGKWTLASGGGYPADESKVKELLAKFPGLEAAEPVSTEAAHHRALEVTAEDNQREVTLKLKDGRSFDFYLGSSPGIKKVHLRFKDKDTVYVVRGLSAWDLGSSPSSWIQSEYLKVDKSKVVAMQLQNEHGQIQLTKGAEGSWEITGLKPDQEIKTTSVDSLVNSACSVNMKAPVGTTVDPAFGLDSPKAVVTLVTETIPETKGKGATSGDKSADKAGADDDPSPVLTEPAPVRKTYVLKIGAKKEDVYYAKSDASPFVVELASWNGDAFLNKKLADLLEEEKKDDKKKSPKKPKVAAASS